MSHAHAKPQPRRRATNLSLRADLVKEARVLRINLSRELEARLEVLVSEARSARWKKENKAALAAYARFFEKHGVWNEELRGW